MTTTKQSWQDVAAAKQADTFATVPNEWLIPSNLMPSKDVLDVTTFPKTSGLFTEEELQITASTASDIVKQISEKVWTSEKVTLAFCKAASVAHQLINCVTETLYPEAQAAAKALDENFARTGQLKGPFHGVPISLKDNFQTAGKASSVGFVGWANDIETSDSSIVKLLKSLGAIVYVKTNVPTAMMIAETINNTFGRTLNPRNRNLTPGGSSGGESALIAFNGSPLGVGTDIGGSLRIPGACTGVFALRPSFGRFPHFDTKSGMAGQEAVISVNGPMARDLEGIKLFTKSVVDSEPWWTDPKCVPVPWREVEVKKRMKIGVLYNDGMVMPTPPVRRALETTVEKLRAAGHEIVEWGVEGHAQASDILAKFFLADGGKTIRNALETSGETWQPQMQAYAGAQEIGVYDMWQIQRERTALCKMYMDRWNACEGLDAILSPTTPYTSVKHGDFNHVGYTCIWNILDYTALSFPTGIEADKELDVIPRDQKSFGELDTQVQGLYDASAVHGMPVSLQLVGRRLQEEKVLAVAERVLEALR